MSLLVSGGGTREMNRAANQFFLQLIDFGNILYIPQAADELLRDYQQSYLYVKEMFEELGAKNIILCESLEDLPVMINHFDGLYFSGGSMNRLLLKIEKYKLKDILKKSAEDKVIYGQSAGAMIWCGDLSYYDECKESTPLEVIPYGLVCHYKAGMKDDIKVCNKRKTFCLPDGTAVFFKDDEYEIVSGKIEIV